MLVSLLAGACAAPAAASSYTKKVDVDKRINDNADNNADTTTNNPVIVVDNENNNTNNNNLTNTNTNTNENAATANADATTSGLNVTADLGGLLG